MMTTNSVGTDQTIPEAAASGVQAFTDHKSVIQMDNATIEIYHSFTLGDMYIILLLTVLIFVTLLSRLIGGR